MKLADNDPFKQGAGIGGARVSNGSGNILTVKSPADGVVLAIVTLL
ncbi:hypothetical protein [Desulforhopalus singaporensis]|uniref:Uncharacterized protein n=1 Tax=Desulforhopalus singaporensis TaxID=91360 RepID=A0A1H0VLW4_9BACT|nr:hypothetical protein [Desulforhopalus singaporensis]SDP79579.1 hypothetical protein SAMN05660330_04145 [Desulforhopalus singaporensis]